MHVGQPQCHPQRGIFAQKALFGLVRRHILKALRCSGLGCTWGCLHWGPGRAFPKWLLFLAKSTGTWLSSSMAGMAASGAKDAAVAPRETAGGGPPLSRGFVLVFPENPHLPQTQRTCQRWTESSVFTLSQAFSRPLGGVQIRKCSLESGAEDLWTPCFNWQV